jgi:hypothetical protein
VDIELKHYKISSTFLFPLFCSQKGNHFSGFTLFYLHLQTHFSSSQNHLKRFWNMLLWARPNSSLQLLLLRYLFFLFNFRFWRLVPSGWVGFIIGDIAACVYLCYLTVNFSYEKWAFMLGERLYCYQNIYFNHLRLVAF